MPRLSVTVEQLSQVVATIYEDRQHMPSKIWVDEFHGHHTFLRATFRDEFTGASVDRLKDLRDMLKAIYGKDSDVTIVVYFRDVPVEHAAERSRLINAVP
jgi:hypothetical protein